MITLDKFKQVFPHCKDPSGWLDAILEVCSLYDISSDEEVASFIAQCGHESGGWVTFEENLNYSGEALYKLFKSHFSGEQDALSYARQPERIANRIYANRMGNGNEASGDGWKYRGRGPIQMTGKDNYTSCLHRMFPEHTPDLNEFSSDKHTALLSAVWFWQTHNLNSCAADCKQTTKIINGGYLGLEERQSLYDALLTA